jgi:hypothetical protein
MTMASMPQSTPLIPVRSIARHRVAFLLLIVGLVAASLALVALQRQSATITVRTPGREVIPAAPERISAIVDAYEQLQFQRLAAAQALRAGKTEAYEIAMSGAEALESHLASLTVRQPTLTGRERAIIDLYDQLHLQRLAAVQALQAGNSEAYEIAMTGADALRSRIASLQAQP